MGITIPFHGVFGILSDLDTKMLSVKIKQVYKGEFGGAAALPCHSAVLAQDGVLLNHQGKKCAQR